MMLTILLIIYAIMLVSAILHIAANMYAKHDRQRRTAARIQYR